MPLTHIKKSPTSFFIIFAKTHTDSHISKLPPFYLPSPLSRYLQKPSRPFQHHHTMTSPPGRTRLTRAGPLVDDSVATHTSELTGSHGTDRRLWKGQRQKTSTTMQDDDTGPALTSGISVPNQGPWHIKPRLERRPRFSVKDSFEADIHKNSMLNVLPETCGDHRRMKVASADSADDHDNGGTRHRSSSVGASQSISKPTNSAGTARPVSTSNPLHERRNPRERKYEAGDYPDTLAGMVEGCYKRDPDASHDARRLVVEYLRR
jgi:hypothetical protein